MCTAYTGDKEVSWVTEEQSRLPKAFYVTYNKVFKPRLQAFNINSLLTVGLEDPFPNEVSYNKTRGHLPEEVPDSQDTVAFVYDTARYIEGNSPYCVYVPCRDIMFKLMRACIAV